MERGGGIYILTNKNKTTLYIGVTSDLQSRIWQHRNQQYLNSFSSKYNLNRCVHYELFPSIEEAINREKQLKKWRREKKIDLITSQNPEWLDLWNDIKEW